MFEKYQGKKWVIGVSGGIDSMALLDMARKSLSIVVCHVNYHKRLTSSYDQSVVERYCKEYQIPLYVLELHENPTYNFQAWARDKRYNFYKEVVEKEKCQGVLLAHHADDFLETALLREKQNRQVNYYGIQKENYVHGLFIARPLLSLFKDDLEKYIEEHDLQYGQDESNFDIHYQRNIIRNIELKNKTKEEKICMIEAYKQKNLVLKKQQNFIKSKIEGQEKNLHISILKENTIDDAKQILRYWLTIQREDLFDVSNKFIDELYDFALYSSGFEKQIHHVTILKEYQTIHLLEKEIETYSITMDELQENKWLKWEKEGTTREALTLFQDDFPLTICNVESQDSIELSFGHKNILKYLKQEKIAYEDRKMWPVLKNAKGNIIFVPLIGANMQHFTNKPSIFVVK